MKKYYIFFVLVSYIFSYAKEFEADGIFYKTLGKNTCCVSSCEGSGYEGSLTIPTLVTSHRQDYTVVGVDDYAFYGCDSLVSISLPESVEYLGNKAFYGCSCLESICGKGVLAVGNSAFGRCSALSDLEVSPNIESIGESAFYNCASLTNFTVSDGTILGKSVFSGCSSLETVILPENMQYIPDYCFKDCVALKNIENTESITEIGEYSFSVCRSLQSFNFGNRLEKIGKGAFSFCADLEIELIGGSEAVIGSYAFQGCASLQNIMMEGVKTIGESAFSNCGDLKSVTMDGSMQKIEANAFSTCVSLESVSCWAALPPAMQRNAFSEDIYRDAVLIVPFDKILLYLQSPPWSYFINVEGDKIAGANEIKNDQAEGIFRIKGRNVMINGDISCADIFDMEGRIICHVANPEKGMEIRLPHKGIYIVRFDNISKKIIIK